MEAKIGILAPYLDTADGIGICALRMIQGIAGEGLSLVIIGSKRNASYCPISLSEAILPDATPRERFFHTKLFALRARVLEHFKDCHAIHAFSESYAPLAHCIAEGRPYFVTVYGSYANAPKQEPKPLDEIYRRAYAGARCLFPISKRTCRVLSEVVPDVSTRIIAPALAKPEYLHFHNRPTQPPIILCVGALKRRKGQMHLVRAMPLILKHFPDARCMLVGPTHFAPDYHAELLKEIGRLHLSNAVIIRDYVSETELHELYVSASVFAFPSVEDGWMFEGFGLALVEAAAFGIPIAASRASAAPELFIDKEEALLLDLTVSDAPARMADALVWIIMNPTPAGEMAMRAKSRAVSNYLVVREEGVWEKEGMKSYSNDLRERVVRRRERGHSAAEVARSFGISKRSVERYWLQHRDSGSIVPKQRGGYRRSRLVGHEQTVRGWIEVQGDLTLEQIQRRLHVELGIELSVSALWYRLDQLGLSFKKNAARRRARTA